MTDRNDPSTLHQWIVDARSGNETALNRLAEYLLPKAFGFARREMMNLSPMEDFEDVALSAVKSICFRFQRGEREFIGEKELSSLLRRFVIGKVRDRRKYHLREKRNVNRTIDGTTDSSQEPQASREVLEHAVDEPNSVWLDEQSVALSPDDQTYLDGMLQGLGADVAGLFSELVKRLDEYPRKVLVLLTTESMSNRQLAEALNCAPASIERYRQAIRRKLEQIVNE